MLLNKYPYEMAMKIYQKKIWIGMTKDMTIDSWGHPENINRTVTINYIREQ